MRNLLIGFAAGAALTSLIFIWRDSDLRDAPSTAAMPVAAAVMPERASIEAPKATTAMPAPKFDPASIEATPADIQAAAAISADRPNVQRPATRREPNADLSDGSLAILAKDRLHPDSMSALYDDFAAEGADGWSRSTEPQLRDYLARTATQRGFDVTAVSCHKTLCQIQAATYPGPDRGLAWSDLMHDMYRQSPPLEVGYARWKTDSQDGRIYVLAFVSRR